MITIENNDQTPAWRDLSQFSPLDYKKTKKVILNFCKSQPETSLKLIPEPELLINILERITSHSLKSIFCCCQNLAHLAKPLNLLLGRMKIEEIDPANTQYFGTWIPEWKRSTPFTRTLDPIKTYLGTESALVYDGKKYKIIPASEWAKKLNTNDRIFPCYFPPKNNPGNLT